MPARRAAHLRRWPRWLLLYLAAALLLLAWSFWRFGPGASQAAGLRHAAAQSAQRAQRAQHAQHTNAALSLEARLHELNARTEQQEATIRLLESELAAARAAAQAAAYSTAQLPLGKPGGNGGHGTADVSAAHDGSRSDEVCRLLPPQPPPRFGLPAHKLAVLVPYRDRADHLARLLPVLHLHLQLQALDFSIFVLEQAPRLRFNRGALLNAGALLLAGSDYDWFAFHDVDTVPTPRGGIAYRYPAGRAPLHLTPPGIHPRVKFEDFFGGIVLITREQFAAVNGFGTHFWGWGREDDNLAHRLRAARRWPPALPEEPPQRNPHHYFTHSLHRKAHEVRVRYGANGSATYFEARPDSKYGDALILASQPALFNDTATGLNTTRFWLREARPHEQATWLQLELHCHAARTPWCQPQQPAAAL